MAEVESGEGEREMSSGELLARMQCPGLGRFDVVSHEETENIAITLGREHLAPMPTAFMPEFYTEIDEENGYEIRIGVAYGSFYCPEDKGQRYALCYLLSAPDWPEGRERQAAADARMRSWLWLLIKAQDVLNSAEICKRFLLQAYPPP